MPTNHLANHSPTFPGAGAVANKSALVMCESLDLVQSDFESRPGLEGIKTKSKLRLRIICMLLLLFQMHKQYVLDTGKIKTDESLCGTIL